MVYRLGSHSFLNDCKTLEKFHLLHGIKMILSSRSPFLVTLCVYLFFYRICVEIQKYTRVLPSTVTPHVMLPYDMYMYHFTNDVNLFKCISSGGCQWTHIHIQLSWILDERIV